jgi:large subunit ribosomal protein L4
LSELEEREEEEDDEEEEEDEEDLWYDMSSRTEPYRAIALPDRLHVPVVTFKEKEEVGKVFLSEHVFGMNPIRPDLLHRVVIYQRNKKRGRRKAITKTISEVSGSGKKMRQQKGLGMARAGHKRPAHWRGGAKAHGPKGWIQNYETKLNKKVRKLGLRHALSQKLLEGNLTVMNDLQTLESHKTKTFIAQLDQFDIAGRYGATALMIDDAHDDSEENPSTIAGVDVNLKVASKNVFKVKAINQLGANVYDILKHEKLVLSLAAIQALEKRLS